MKVKNFNIKFDKEPEKEIPLDIKITSLNEKLDKLLTEIEKVDLNEFDSLDENILKCAEETGDCDELARTSNNQEYIYSMQAINNKFRNVQSRYISQKFNILNKKLEKSVDETNDHVNSITGNMLLSVIALFLGISLTSAMITTAGEIDDKMNLLTYYIGIAWTVVLIIGTATIFTRKFDKKSKLILAVIVIASIIFLTIIVCKLNK